MARVLVYVYNKQFLSERGHIHVTHFLSFWTPSYLFNE